MKKRLLLFSLIVMNSVTSPGQTNAPRKFGKLLSKQEFETGVSQLKSLLEQSKEKEGREKWVEVHQMMLSEFAVIKERIKEAVEMGNESDKDTYMAVYTSQLTIYTDVVRCKNDLIGGKTDLIHFLQSYVEIFK